jgi:hypothetical protein
VTVFLVMYGLFFPPAWGFWWVRFLRRRGIRAFSGQAYWLAGAVTVLAVFAFAGRPAPVVAADVSALAAAAALWGRREAGGRRAR